MNWLSLWSFLKSLTAREIVIATIVAGITLSSGSVIYGQKECVTKQQLDSAAAQLSQNLQSDIIANETRIDLNENRIDDLTQGQNTLQLYMVLESGELTEPEIALVRTNLQFGVYVNGDSLLKEVNKRKLIP